MKKIFLFFIIYFSIFTHAQESAFVISNKQVLWQRVYESSKTIAEVKDILLSTGKIKFTGEDTHILNGEISDFIMDFKGAGFTSMGTPIYLKNSSKFFGNFKIEFKEGKYRVTATNIKLKGDSLSIFSGGIGFTSSGDDNLESYALTNDREFFKSAFDGRASRIVNYSFAQLFDVSKYSKHDDNW
ncbi:hypothetical protein [Chryseobacterium sp. JK1]|uniref:hypothetical protein n=1 Tax=Chryseobacterium sp. JK1 TaxID=874294 RepID=UPI003D68FEB8